MKPNLDRHLFGIYSAFKAQIELVNASIGHSGTQGGETENAIINLLKNFLPSGYGIGSGMIIDAEGNSSSQIDIIIYDNTKPNYTLNRTSKIFLVDQVIATIEVKTNFSKSELQKGLENIKSVKTLKPNNKTEIEQLRHPVCVLFFYTAKDVNSAVKIDDHFRLLESEVTSFHEPLRPNLLMSLEHCSLYRGKLKESINNIYSVVPDYGVVLAQSDKPRGYLQYPFTDKTKALVRFSRGYFTGGEVEISPIRSKARNS